MTGDARTSNLEQLSENDGAEHCQSALARTYFTMITRALDDKGLEAVALAAGVDRSTISRLRSGHMEYFCDALVSLGFQIVPADKTCVSADEIEPIYKLAQMFVGSVPDAKSLLALLGSAK